MRALWFVGLGFAVLGSAGFGMGALQPGADGIAIAGLDVAALGHVAEAASVEAPAPEPPEPLRIGLQAGHWLAQEAPDELSGLRTNGGTSGGGKYEWEINLEIAQLTAALLEEDGYLVDVLPATVPQRYEADVFIAIHADGNNDGSVNGYRVAAPRRDYTSRAQGLADTLAEAYGEVTGIRRIPTVTRRMQGYYAFNSRRYRHAIHQSTVGVIIETGFLTSALDRRILVDDQTLAAQGIFEGIRQYLGPAVLESEIAETAQLPTGLITE